MRLVSVGVENVGRFAERSVLSCDGKLVAILGPNEAGKSSLLRALTHLSTRAPFEDHERTRGSARTAPSRPVWARYLIEDDDRAAFTGVGVEKARWYVHWIALNGDSFHEIEGGGPTRDRGPRKKAVGQLRRAAEHRLLAHAEEHQVIAASAASLADDLDEDGEDLDEELIARIRVLAEQWPGGALKAAPKYLTELADSLLELATHEESQHPGKGALRHLSSRRPQFLSFGPDERDLRSDYDLSVVADDLPVALDNLSRLADLDLPSLRDAINSDRGVAARMLEDANGRLRTVFDESWHQEGVYLRLDTDEHILRVFVSAPERYTEIAERSDGLRAFLALLTFSRLNSTATKKPVLLVDEAEMHLHYDAQADLVRVFTKQEAAVKIIYTTHSAGCLPEDLGVGVRVVVPDAETATSRIENSFWSGGPGFTPLLLGMGASAFSFAATRHAVLVEGGSDVVLLPTILRQATGLESLDCQVAPGLAEVHPLDVSLLDREAGRVAYLVDNDSDGTRIANKLTNGGIPEDRIVRLGVGADLRTPEDLLAAEVYATAVNAELASSHGTHLQVSATDLPECDRAAYVAGWCAIKQIEPPAKVRVAYRVLDQAAQGRDLVATDRLLAVRQTYLALRAALGPSDA